MARKKHLHLQEVQNLSNVLHDPPREPGIYFPNQNPLTLELGCGKGEYTLELAQKHPERNFIGIDQKGDRLWHGAKKALALELTNVLFMRIYIENIASYFVSQSIDAIWITFPDPFRKKTDAKKRLISPRFHLMYREMLKSDGLAHLKTDNELLFAYAKEVLATEPVKIINSLTDVHSMAIAGDDLAITTTFEKKYLLQGKPIMYTAWSYINKDEPFRAGHKGN